MTNHLTTKHSSSQIQIPVNFPNQIVIEPSEHEHFKSQNPESSLSSFDHLPSLKVISASLNPISFTRDFVSALFNHHHCQFLFFLFFLLALISPNLRMVNSISISTKSSNTHHPLHPLIVPTNVRNRRQASATAAAAAFVIIEQISPSISVPLGLNSQLSPQLEQPPPWSCNFTAYPYEGCNILFEAYCDRESNTCVCDDHQTTSSNSGPKSKKNSRHRKRYCLGPVDLGKRCQSSGQCRVRDPNSACYAEKGFDDWRCMCADGFVEKDGKCETNPEYQKSDNPYERCAALGQVYVSVLERCLDRSHLPYYAHRSAGRAGGGRGGGSGGRGRGGVGGRGAGSRAWYSSDRNLMRKNSSNNLRSNLLNISTLSLISSYLIYLLATKHL